MDHLRRVVRRAAGGQRVGRDQPGEPDAPEVHLARLRLGRELLVVPTVVPAEVLAVELVRPVHRGREVVVVLLHPAGRGLHLERRQPVGGDARRVEEDDRPAVALALLLGEFEHVQGTLDVDLVGQRRAELAAGG